MLAQQYQMMGREQEFEREFEKFTELTSSMLMKNQAGEGEAPPP